MKPFTNGNGSINRIRIIEQTVAGIVIGAIVAVATIFITIPRLEGKIETLTQMTAERINQLRNEFERHRASTIERGHAGK